MAWPPAFFLPILTAPSRYHQGRKNGLRSAINEYWLMMQTLVKGCLSVASRWVVLNKPFRHALLLQRSLNKQSKKILKVQIQQVPRNQHIKKPSSSRCDPRTSFNSCALTADNKSFCIPPAQASHGLCDH